MSAGRKPARDHAIRLITICAIWALAAPLAAASASAASAERETRSYAAGHFMLTLGGDRAVLGSPGSRGAPQLEIAIDSWSWGAAQAGAGAAAPGRGAPIDPAIPVPGVVAPRDLASGQASGRRKGWDGTVKGGSVAETSNAAKFGAISGIRRNDKLTDPAARTIPPPADGSMTVDGSFPGCTVGTKYADAVLQVPGARYELTGVEITGCPAPAPAARSSMAGEYARAGLSLNYKKVKVRAWDPEKKEAVVGKAD